MLTSASTRLAPAQIPDQRLIQNFSANCIIMLFIQKTLMSSHLDNRHKRLAGLNKDVGLAWRSSTEFTPAMRAFRSYFQQAFGLPQR